jgi:hypothetical protein
MQQSKARTKGKSLTATEAKAALLRSAYRKLLGEKPVVLKAITQGYIYIDDGDVSWLTQSACVSKSGVAYWTKEASWMLKDDRARPEAYLWWKRCCPMVSIDDVSDAVVERICDALDEYDLPTPERGGWEECDDE